MEWKELYCLINLQPEIIQKLESISDKMDIKEIDLYLEQLMDMETAEQSYEHLKLVFQDDADNLKMLYCQLECARRIYVKYKEKHISDVYFIDTMKCFSRFMDECRKKNGRMFFDRGWWTYRQISMNIFRIGSLEYQFCLDDGEKVIGVHIPSDADLSKKSVDESLAQAKKFFHTYYYDYEYSKFICSSWLLSPALGALLSEKSNILAFQQRFDIIREDRETKEYMEWLFQVPMDTSYESLPESTRLQKEVKNLLLNGGTIGSADGVMKK